MSMEAEWDRWGAHMERQDAGQAVWQRRCERTGWAELTVGAQKGWAA